MWLHCRNPTKTNKSPQNPRAHKNVSHQLEREREREREGGGGGGVGEGEKNGV